MLRKPLVYRRQNSKREARININLLLCRLRLVVVKFQSRVCVDCIMSSYLVVVNFFSLAYNEKTHVHFFPQLYVRRNVDLYTRSHASLLLSSAAFMWWKRTGESSFFYIICGTLIRVMIILVKVNQSIPTSRKIIIHIECSFSIRRKTLKEMPQVFPVNVLRRRKNYNADFRNLNCIFSGGSRLRH